MPGDVPLRALGHTGLRLPALGVGTNRWGHPGKDADHVIGVYSAAIDAGANLFDSAEVYSSEPVIGECRRRDPRPSFIVSKYLPLPQRLTSRSFHQALDASLERLGLDAIDLYLIHFPYVLGGPGPLIDRLAEVAKAGKARAVGVSNFSARQMYAAAAGLERHGIPLAANEVHFSLFHRNPERNGVLEACRNLDAALIAWRPLGGGQAENEAATRIARERQKSVAQVALNWLLQKDERVIAIPGATSVAHLRANIGAVGWTLTESELAALG
ncbi:MAG TPA: aldo/keto reductase [Candidatus Dormibacteraeota bacterium]|nr:aldo/keto reductase [Candidatus Dormibacteraeota bacterium]